MRHANKVLLPLALAAALLLYGVAYRSMVRTRTLRGGVEWCDPGSLYDWSIKPQYRIGGEFSTVFFWPAHALDRRIRPEDWEVDLLKEIDIEP
jgi:hypothetical protein